MAYEHRGYFEADDSNREIPSYSARYPPGPRDDSFPRQTSRNPQQQQSSTNNMTTSLDYGDGVSPELVAAITERVKKERKLPHIPHASS